MTPKKLRQISTVRETVNGFRNHPHVLRCRCCRHDLDEIEANADLPQAFELLMTLKRRIDAISE